MFNQGAFLPRQIIVGRIKYIYYEPDIFMLFSPHAVYFSYHSVTHKYFIYVFIHSFVFPTERIKDIFKICAHPSVYSHSTCSDPEQCIVLQNRKSSINLIPGKITELEIVKDKLTAYNLLTIPVVVSGDFLKNWRISAPNITCNSHHRSSQDYTASFFKRGFSFHGHGSSTATNFVPSQPNFSQRNF